MLCCAKNENAISVDINIDDNELVSDILLYKNLCTYNVNFSFSDIFTYPCNSADGDIEKNSRYIELSVIEKKMYMQTLRNCELK